MGVLLLLRLALALKLGFDTRHVLQGDALLEGGTEYADLSECCRHRFGEVSCVRPTTHQLRVDELDAFVAGAR